MGKRARPRTRVKGEEGDGRRKGGRDWERRSDKGRERKGGEKMDKRRWKQKEEAGAENKEARTYGREGRDTRYKGKRVG